jgi:RNA polymerase sigma factor (sigma-70 family)
MTRAAGDADFDAAFRELFARSYALALRILADRADAEDAASEALARALASWRRVGQLPWRDGWVLRVTANVSVDIVRKRARTAGGTPSRFSDSEVDNRLLVRDLLARLPERQREVLALRYLADMTEQETADHLRISIGSVKRHAHRGLSRLRRFLDEAEVPVPNVLEWSHAG